ncbi:MAG: cytochrome c [Acidobacteriota bacterium]|nr:cytochrome c [Acidobacteriota bacterium]
MIEQYLSPSELKRLLSALLVVALFIAIMALFGFLVVPGTRNVNQPRAASAVESPQGETGWLDPTDYPATARQVLPPIDPRTVMTPNPALMARGKALFAENCATCHGPDGRGDGAAGASLNPKPRNFTQPTGWVNGYRIEDIYKTLREGVKGSGMVSFNYLNRKDRMALVHVVQSFGAFDHGPEDPKALDALAKTFASSGEVIPDKIPVAFAEHQLAAEFQPAPPIPSVASNPLLGAAITDPVLAAQTLAGIPRWQEDDKALATAVSIGLPGNGFAPEVATYAPDQWKALQSALAGH